MQGFVTVLMLTLLPALGNFGGGLLAEFLPVSQRALNLALHAAAGIILAVVGVELMPQALQVEPAWIIVLFFVVGGVFSIGLDKVVHFVQRAPGQTDGQSQPWMIYLGTAIDLFSDGIIIGTGSTIDLNLGILLALGQVPADIPEGFATVASFKESALSRQQRVLMSASFILPILLGSTIGYWAVSGRSDLLKFGLLAFTAGILVTIAVEELLVSAHDSIEKAGMEEGRLATLMLVGGFALFVLLGAYFE